MEAQPSEKTIPPFGRYLIRERMAQGGMGEVFLAVAVGEDGFEKPVVIKRLLPKFAGRADIVSLLAAEAKLMTRLIHPNIVQVIDFGRATKTTTSS
jgi:serine/threonine protein kinase